MKMRKKSLLLTALLLVFGVTSAKLPDDAPPLPPPTGTIINVSTWNELMDAVWYLQSNTTILIQPGTYTIPEWWFLNVGRNQENAIDNIVIRGSTGNFNDVIIKGSSPGMDGTSQFGFFINNATNVTIADLTVGEVAYHAVTLNPPVIGAADGIRIYHCRFYDTGEQLVKGNSLLDNNGFPEGVNHGRIEYCLIEYTGWGPLDGYTQGIDLHACDDWVIQHNLLRNIRVAENTNHTHVPAILIWNNASSVIVNSNTMINCDRGVAFGLFDRTTIQGYPEVNTGLICNNMIFRQQDSVFYNDAGIMAWDTRNVSIINNSVLDEYYYYPPIEYRFVHENSNYVIANNLVNPTTNGFRPAIWDRDNSGGDPQDDYQNATVINNFTGATNETYTLNYMGDLHLNENYADSLFGIETLSDCLNDFDESLRGEFTHYGADHSNQMNFETVATHSFTNFNGGTHPNSLTINGNQIMVDLTSIAGTSILRATFDPGRDFNYYDLTENPFYESTMALSCDGTTLQLLAPRFKTFDVTDAAINSLLSGNMLTITVDELGAGFGDHVSLDVLCNAPLPTQIEQVSDADARFINGDAFITFHEVNTPITIDKPTYQEFNIAYQNVMNGNIRYRIYRSNHPIIEANDIIQAELIDEIYPLSGWNPELEGPERVFPYMGREGGAVTRLPVDNEILADIGTGIYVNRFNGHDPGETAWYFISHTVDGAEDFSSISPGMNATNFVEESPGSGVVLLSKIQHENNYNYELPSTLYFYTKWECPPAAAFPNEASNYLVGLRDDIDYSTFRPGVSLKVHCWSANLFDNCGWWFEADQGHILVAGNQFPFHTWWVGHHSSKGTLKSYHDGTVQPFTPFRLMNFVYDFIRPEYNIDTNKIMLSGNSMGGSGSSMLGIRNGQLFSNLNSWVGVHNPGQTPWFEGSYEIALGDSSWHCNYTNVDFTAKYGGIEVKPEENYDVWDYFNNAKWLDAHPNVEIPWHSFGNGKNDDAIGWPQAQEYVQTLIDHKLPFNFNWGMFGHNQRVQVLDPYGYEMDRNSRIVFRKNQSFPVFSNASTNDDLMNADEGQINSYFTWDTDSIVDRINEWHTNLRLIERTEIELVTTDVTPRRLQHFMVNPDSLYFYSFYENNEVLVSDSVRADHSGFLTVPGLEIVKANRKLVIESTVKQILPVLFINELMANNQTSITDPQGEHEDWIEIFNPSEKTVNLAGMYFQYVNQDSVLYRISSLQPDSTSIQPHGYLVLWADNETQDGVLHLGFNLSDESGEIRLLFSDATTAIDSVIYSAQAPDISYGRIYDGYSLWKAFENPTPGASNVSTSNGIATHSFTNYNGGTHPNSLSVSGNTISVNLNSIAGGNVYRAILNPGRNFNYYNLTENPFYESTMTLSCNGETLELMAPRYKTFDATSATTNCMLNGNILTIQIENPGSGFGDHVSLDVLCNVPLTLPVQQVTQAEARFINGDAFITFMEVDTPITESEPEYLEFNNVYQEARNGNIRYRIYRSPVPVSSPQDILNAELIDEIYPLSGWNPELEGPERVFPYYGQSGFVSRLPVDDSTLAEVGTGIYVNRYQGIQDIDTAWYFVSHTVDGAEDFSAIIPGMNLTNFVEESHGSGVVFLNKVQHENQYIYEPPSTLYFYTKWECPPAAAFPNEASNYLVVLRDDIDYTTFQPGVSLKLHCWGGTLLNQCNWWFGSDQGHIMVAGNQFPFQTWWVGHHSSLGTLKSYNDGTVQPFTPFRMMNFIYDFMRTEYNIDTTKIMLSGSSMGGSGTSMIGIRNGQLFSNLNGWVGVHDPGNTPTFEGSYEAALGDSSWHCIYSNVDFTSKYGGIEVKPEDHYNVWDYFNNSKWLDAHPGAEIPWHTFSNGENDDAIGWPQAVDYVQTLIEHKLPFNFTWGQNGHGQRAMVLAPYGYESDRNSLITFQSNQSFPVFSNASLDNDLLSDPEGQINNYFYWATESIKDSVDSWEVSISLSDRCPENSLIADITPRRLQHFATLPGENYVCSWYEDETLLAQDTIMADEGGLVTFANLEITKDLRRLAIEHISTQIINIPAGWSGISGYVVPPDKDILVMFENMEQSLIFLGNLTGSYVPHLGINTLNEWDSHSGYMIKTSEPAFLKIEGSLETELTIQLQSGWNLIPVTCSENVSAETLFAPLGNAFEVAVDVAGLSVFWPAYGIQTLSVLIPGKSYFVRVNQPVILNFQQEK